MTKWWTWIPDRCYNPNMTIDKALELFKEKNVPEYAYVTNGKLGNGECAGIQKTGVTWTTYYSERGEKKHLREFSTESEAVISWINAVSEICDK